MSKTIKTVRGYVVDHKSSGVRYAVSESNYNAKVHTKVRELKQNETVLGFRPRRIEKSKPQEASAPAPTPSQAPSPEGSQNNTK